MFQTLNISASGLVAQRLRMDTIAGNIAHVNTTQAEDGTVQPFQRRLVMLHAGKDHAGAPAGGVPVRSEVEVDTASPPRIVHDPGHPHADAQGNVRFPNINLLTEFVNAVEASRAYEANVTTMQITRDMLESTFRLIG